MKDYDDIEILEFDNKKKPIPSDKTEVFMKHLLMPFIFAILLLCSCHSKTASTESTTITAEMAYEGVNNYCHSEYDWSIAEDNPSIMNVTMGDETEFEYKVVFRSYTGAFVYFYVEKASGTTRMVEVVPMLNIEEETGTINLFDYLEK